MGRCFRSSRRRRESRARGLPYRSSVTGEPRPVKLYFITQFLPTSSGEDVFPMRAMHLACVEIQRVVSRVMWPCIVGSTACIHHPTQPLLIRVSTTKHALYIQARGRGLRRRFATVRWDSLGPGERDRTARRLARPGATLPAAGAPQPSMVRHAEGALRPTTTSLNRTRFLV